MEALQDFVFWILQMLFPGVWNTHTVEVRRKGCEVMDSMLYQYIVLISVTLFTGDKRKRSIYTSDA